LSNEVFSKSCLGISTCWTKRPITSATIMPSILRWQSTYWSGQVAIFKHGNFSSLVYQLLLTFQHEIVCSSRSLFGWPSNGLPSYGPTHWTIGCQRTREATCSKEADQ
jgi:hypothetical protein